MRIVPVVISAWAMTCLMAAALRAQVTETPTAFDSAGRVHVLTPALVTRLKLAAPAWPVSGDFRQAKLYESSAGTRVLTVERPTGAIERFALNSDEATALRVAVDSALAVTGAIGTEESGYVVSEPARGAFVRNQMLTTWTLHGPLLSYISGDSRLAAAAYLFATGASYFITNRVASKEHVTRAQNALTTDGAFRGAAFGTGVLYVLAGSDPGPKEYATAALLGGLSGTVYGFRRARPMTDAEVEATTAFSTLGAVTAFLAEGTLGVYGDDPPAQAEVAPILASAVAGYAFGGRYVRRSSYGVTQGDVELLKLGAGLGALAGLTAVANTSVSNSVGFGVTTAGFLGGALLTHYKWVRPYEHSTGDATQVDLGATAGALLGMGMAVLTKPAPQGTFAMLTVGAIGGAIAGHAIANAPRAGTRRADASGSSPAESVEFHLENLVSVATRQPGAHPLLTIRF